MSEAAEQEQVVDERHVSAFPMREKVGRVLWAIVQATLFRWSFHNMYTWRRMLLQIFGAKIDRTARVRRTVRVECPWNLTIGANSSIGDRAHAYCLGPVALGQRVTISQNVHLCAGTHDHRKPDMPLIRPPIEIGDDVWIAADAYVGPGVRVGHGALLSERGVALEHLDAWTIYRGNPAQAVKSRKYRSAPADQSEHETGEQN